MLRMWPMAIPSDRERGIWGRSLPINSGRSLAEREGAGGSMVDRKLQALGPRPGTDDGDHALC